MRSAEEILATVRKRVDELLRSRLSSDRILAELQADLFNVDEEEIVRSLFAEQIAEIDFISQRLTDLSVVEEAAQIVDVAGAQYAKTTAGLNYEVVDEVDKLLRKDASDRDIRDAVERQIGRRRFYFASIARTATGAFEQASKVAEWQSLGFQKFRYTGPPAERGFCRKHLGKVYTLEEIKKLDNGQGLPVFLYRGGFNCRHGWEPEPGDGSTVVIP